ncbi:MAG TPA: PQQ-binding-like beta-propeller repeat protein [Gammaproteobacteria bacterium]|jgi:alcohol dehydrogenase (cytochrome c)
MRHSFISPKSGRIAASVATIAIYLAIAPAAVAQAQPEQAPAFSGDRLRALPSADWVTNGGNIYNQRYSPLMQVNRGNVASLRGEWRTRLRGSGLDDKYSGEATPLVYAGVVYIITGADDVFAVSVETGEILWAYTANLDESINVICCGWTSRGLGMGDGRIYVGQLDGRLVALDQRNGEVVWSVQAEPWQRGFSITSAPLYYDGLVVTGFAGAENGVQGRLKAYDARTGEHVWTFYTVPNPGEIGHDTWPAGSDVYQYGGATVWQTPAVDPELGLMYFSTGNPGPDFNGNVREGDNLFANSIVAIEARTGEYRWHFQQVHHDLWDYDAPSPVVLFDIELDGRMRKALAEPGKTGWVYILDRETGEPLIGIEERPAPQDAHQKTSPTQPHPIGDAFVPQEVDILPEGYPPLINQGRIFTPFGPEGAVIKPSHNGGANWSPSSYDPDTGFLYVCATDRMSFFRGGIEEEYPMEVGDRYLGGRFGALPVHISGIFAALDMHTNKLVWRYRWRDRCHGGSVTTAGGLVFSGRHDGRLTALNSSDGTVLWEFQTGAGMNAPVAIFEHEGSQYIAAFSAGNAYIGSPRGDSLWLFSLQGTLDEVATPGAQPMLTAIPDRTPNLANGRTLFEGACAFCHGSAGEGGHAGGTPLIEATDLEFVMLRVTQGFNAMPPFGATLTLDEIHDVGAYVVEELPH